MEKTRDANLFWLELEEARRFEAKSAQRSRGLVVLWIGLFGMFFAGVRLMPQFDKSTSDQTLILITSLIVAYFAFVIGLAAYFRHAFSWRGVWRTANAWTWGGLGGFLGAYFVAGPLFSFVSALGPDLVPGEVGELAAIGVSLLAINIAARDRTEILIGIAQVGLAAAAYGMPNGPDLRLLVLLAVFLPTLVLGIGRIWGVRANR